MHTYIYIHIHTYIHKYKYNLQVTKLFIVTSATKGGWLPPHPRFRVRFKILYRVIQHCLLSKMVYFNLKYVIATRSYEFFLYIRKITLEISHFRGLLYL